MSPKKDFNTLNTSESQFFHLDPSSLELLEVVSIGMVILSSEGLVLYANPEACDLFGVDNDIIGSRFEELFFIDSVLDTKKLFIDVMNGRSFKKQQILQIKHREQEAIWGVINISSVKNLHSEDVILCQINNISELKDYEETHTQQTHLLLELINSIQDNIFIKNNKGEFMLANVWVSKLMGVNTPQELLGKTDFDFHPKKLAKKYFRDEQEVMKTGKAKMNIIEQVVEGNNNRRWYSTSKLPLKNNQGEIIGIMGVGRDITTWVKEQKALRKAKITAERADQLKSAFLANLSHEIRTPLNGILGFSQFLKQSLPNQDKNQKYIDFILANGKQLLHQISDIIDISKINSGQLSIYKKNFNLNEMMVEVESLFHEKIKELGLDNIQLHLELERKNEHSIIFNDDLRIKQVLGNFLNNAIKFTHHGTIRFGYITKEENIRFYIIDTGIGISPENLKLIFERFRQVDFSLARKYEGAGLGLAIADGIVKLLDGEIGVQSKINKGSEFYFTIPYEKALSETINQEELSENVLKNKKIVVVNDLKSSYDLLEIMLFQNEVEVWHAKNQNEFYEFISSRLNKINLIILHFQTTWLAGLSSIQKIKSINSKIPLVLIMNDPKDLEKEECMAAGANDYIVEPINNDLFIGKLKKLLK